MEKAIFESGVSKVMNSVIGRFGIKDSFWWKLLFYTLIIYMLLTCLVMFYRTDFINLTFSTASFFMIVYGEFKRRKVYITLLYTSIATLVLDIIWLIIFSGVSKQSKLYRFELGLEWWYTNWWRGHWERNSKIFVIC